MSMNFEAPVTYVRDATDPLRFLNDEEKILLRSAVQLAISCHQAGETPPIMGAEIDLYGIDAIRAVRDLKDFPRA